MIAQDLLLQRGRVQRSLRWDYSFSLVSVVSPVAEGMARLIRVQRGDIPQENGLFDF